MPVVESSGQIAVYLATSELERRLDFLRNSAANLLRIPPAQRQNALNGFGQFFAQQIPGVEMILVDTEIRRFPQNATVNLPDAQGVVALNGEYHAWVNLFSADSRLSILVPLSREYLSNLVPGLGEISFISFDDGGSGERRRIRLRSDSGIRRSAANLTIRVPAALNRFDLEIFGGARLDVAEWDRPGSHIGALFGVRSRMSEVLKVLFSQKADWDNSYAIVMLTALGIAFLVVEMISLAIGISLSRTITLAVHNLYEGTQRVMEGDFSHRIRLKGRDQIAALGQSFNRMTENVERLLEVAKEKERYEAELSIAREIQAQLYPRTVPESDFLFLTALYKPARMVSGDYYDYRRVGPDKVAVAMGDVAGKGISAALLMATIQSAFRARLHRSVSEGGLQTADIVSELNLHLHANTPAEKFATFFLGIYDESNSTLSYTNAGHLPPILVRNGKTQRLEVDGMVIGAFPFAKYGTSTVQLEPGDVVIWFTDGISEPENEYGEMFGEDRLIELILKNAGRGDKELVSTIIEAVEKWTGSPELQDDMTLLVARRK